MALTLGRIDRTAGVIDHLSKKCNPWERRIKIGELVAFNSIARPVVCPPTPDYPSLNYRFDIAAALAKAEQSNEYHECGESMTPKTLHRVKRGRGQAKSASKRKRRGRGGKGGLWPRRLQSGCPRIVLASLVRVCREDTQKKCQI